MAVLKAKNFFVDTVLTSRAELIARKETLNRRLRGEIERRTFVKVVKVVRRSHAVFGGPRGMERH
jgi:hypothetical protein